MYILEVNCFEVDGIGYYRLRRSVIIDRKANIFEDYTSPQFTPGLTLTKKWFLERLFGRKVIYIAE